MLELTLWSPLFLKGYLAQLNREEGLGPPSKCQTLLIVHVMPYLSEEWMGIEVKRRREGTGGSRRMRGSGNWDRYIK